MANITVSANVDSLMQAADYAAMRTLLGLVIGTNVQAFSALITRQIAAPVPLTPVAGTISTNAALGTTFDVTLVADSTLANPTNPADGYRVLWRIKQDGTGGWTLTLGSAFLIPSSTALTSPLNSATFVTANKSTTLLGIYNAATSKWWVSVEQEGY